MEDPKYQKKILFSDYFKQKEQQLHVQQAALQTIQQQQKVELVEQNQIQQEEEEHKNIPNQKQFLNEKVQLQKPLAPAIPLNLKNAKSANQNALMFPEIFQNQFLTYIVGPPGSGKSTILNEMITNDYLYGKYFNRYFFVSPNHFSELQIEGVNWIKNLDLQSIYQFISETNQAQISNQKLCLVLDDVISSINSLSKDKLMAPLILNRRHLLDHDKGSTISIFITSQKYNMLPLKYRVQITSAILFYVCQKEWMDIKQEIIKHSDLKQVQRVIEKECTGDHKFIYIHNTNPIKIFNSQFKQLHLF